MEDYYEAVNAVWPLELPQCTLEEATRAARKLIRHFSKRRSGWVRRCWVCLTPPFNNLNRGWRRLVHDVSHRIYRHEYGLTVKEHSRLHAEIELAVAKYVIESGWLNGALRSVPKPKRDRAAHAKTMLALWQSRAKRTKTMLAKWTRKVRYYERRLLKQDAQSVA